jgi:hypothetical protein
VSDFLEALADAAPPRPRGEARQADADDDGARWRRARAHLAPRSAEALAAAEGRASAWAPWRAVAPGGAFLGYELLSVRRAPRGGAVVVARERTLPPTGSSAQEATCAYVVAPVGAAWKLVDRRGGRDFSDRELATRYASAWDDPGPSLAAGDGRPRS